MFIPQLSHHMCANAQLFSFPHFFELGSSRSGRLGSTETEASTSTSSCAKPSSCTETTPPPRWGESSKAATAAAASKNAYAR